MQRYGLYARRDHSEAWMSSELEADGDWVRAEDALALEARMAELEAILTRIVAADEVDALILEAKALLNLK